MGWGDYFKKKKMNACKQNLMSPLWKQMKEAKEKQWLCSKGPMNQSEKNKSEYVIFPKSDGTIVKRKRSELGIAFNT